LAGTSDKLDVRLPDKCLNETLFASLSHARAALCNWHDDYNHVRPHSGIGVLTPVDAARRLVRPSPGRAP